jgi:enoyl-CoA hydratase
VSLAVELRGEGLWLTLPRPERRNALTAATVAELREAIRTDARAIVITGSEGAFCAGADLEEVLASGVEFLRPVWETFAELRALPVPVIAAVNGPCVAGGLELVLCCDLVVAAEGARFADGHARFGMLPAIGGAAGLARVLGPFRAKELLFLAQWRSPAEMAAAGLVNRVVPDADLVAEVDALVADLAARSPEVLRAMKAMVNDGLDLSWEAAALAELDRARAHWGSPAFTAGLEEFTRGAGR